MKKEKYLKVLLSIFIVINTIIVATLGYYVMSAQKSLIIKGHYICDDNKEIRAIFDNNSKEVTVYLDDGRSYLLPQVLSASGAKYAIKSDNSVFWTKGDTAFFMENDIVTYANCNEIINQ